uniref:F-box domain-containing protein n=1 Tax=Tanacetum cinerariifolium TaxID=118510 RepID=A0A6L2L3U6_TANCI|nr:F-box domain-containing protein [Tanacetum cinerariifolium]
MSLYDSLTKFVVVRRYPVDSYDDEYMSLFNDEEQPAKSSLNDLELQQEHDIVDVKDGILEQQPNADKGKTVVIQETVRVYFPINKPKQHWCLAQLEMRTGVVTFYDSLGYAGGIRRRWWRRMKKALPSYMLSLDHNLKYSPLVTVVNDSNLFMDWKKLNNDSLPRESIRFKRSSQVVVGRLIFWAGQERFVSVDGHIVFKKHLLVSFVLICHSFQVHDIDAVFRDDLTVPMCLSSIGKSLILSGSTDETD